MRQRSNIHLELLNSELTVCMQLIFMPGVIPSIPESMEAKFSTSDPWSSQYKSPERSGQLICPVQEFQCHVCILEIRRSQTEYHWQSLTIFCKLSSTSSSTALSSVAALTSVAYLQIILFVNLGVSTLYPRNFSKLSIERLQQCNYYICIFFAKMYTNCKPLAERAGSEVQPIIFTAELSTVH